MQQHGNAAAQQHTAGAPAHNGHGSGQMMQQAPRPPPASCIKTHSLFLALQDGRLSALTEVEGFEYRYPFCNGTICYELRIYAVTL